MTTPRCRPAQQQFVLYCQPMFDHNSQMVGAEALIRWQHPRKGLVTPDAATTVRAVTAPERAFR